MAVSSTANDPQETHLPEGRSIFDLITSNNLDAIRSILTPLTLRDRQLVVYQKVYKKTLLYYACELGFKDIVKYLLDECGADIDDGYCDSGESASPIRAAVKNLDVYLMTLLMRRGATIGDKIREADSVDYTFNKGYYSLMSMLRLYKNRLNCSNLILSRAKGVDYKGLFAFSWVSEYAYDIRSKDFMAATVCGRVDRMKLLLAGGVNTNLKTSQEENALCLAIMNDQRNAQNFLINNRIYTLRYYATALELCGAKFIVFRADKQKGIDCWRESLRVRRENRIGFEDKNQMRVESDLGIEFQTEEELDLLQNRNDGNLYLQALIVFRRLLSRFSQLSHNAFIIVARHRIFKDNPLRPLQILSELYDFPSDPHQGIRCPSFRAVGTIAMVFRSRFLYNLHDETEFLHGFRTLYNFLDADTWAGLLRGGPELYRIAYGELLELVLKYIQIMERYDLSSEDIDWVGTSVREMLQRCSYPYPTTLMHRAICSEFPLSVISFLLKCSADANFTDALGNTPLHLVSLLAKEDSNLFPLTYIFLKAGGHIDSANKYGIRPLENLKAKHVIKNPLKFLSLQCLAAQAITKHKIDVSEENLPKILVKFVRLHSPVV